MMIKQNILVPYSPEQMYDLVNDIEKYPEFLPWCHKATVHSRNEKEVKATLEVGKGMFHLTFTTLNRLQPNNSIEVILVKGPFRSLNGFWRFERVGREEGEEKGNGEMKGARTGAGTQIYFDLEFVFQNPFLDAASKPFLKMLAQQIMQAFCERAKQTMGSARNN